MASMQSWHTWDTRSFVILVVMPLVVPGLRAVAQHVEAVTSALIGVRVQVAHM